MATIMTALTLLGSKLAVGAATAGTFLGAHAGTIGTALAAGGTIYSGIQANQSAKTEAKSLKRKGDAEFAGAQAEARKRRQEKDLVLSRQQAVAAASGGSASDASVQSVMGKTEIAGETNALMEMYNGAVLKSDLYSEAATVRKEGKSKLMGSLIDAGSTIYGDVAKRRREKTYYA